jgi:DNA/RNA-binding domain of Phe-tRNA-synthetase-like protein
VVKNNPTFPPEVDYKLPGWDLFWAELTIANGANGLGELRESLTPRVKQIMKGMPVSEHPTCQSVRVLFRNSGCDPTKYRPSSEALIRRLLKGDHLPEILPAVDINNIWSVEMLVPCCVINPASLSGPLTLRKGQPGEMMASMKGPFNLDGKPVLVDDEGPFGTPVTDSERVKVKGKSGTFWLVAYLPKRVVEREAAASALKTLTDQLKGVDVIAKP